MLTPLNASDENTVVTASDLASHLRLDTVTTDDEYLLTAYASAAQGYAQKLRGECFSSQQFLFALARPVSIDDSVYSEFRNINSYGDDVLFYVRLPLSPLISIDAVQYYDLNNALQTMPVAAYRVVGGTRPASIVFTNSLPTLYSREDAIKITFTVGYTDSNPIPETVTIAIRLLASEWYRTREYLTASGKVEVPLGGVPAVDRLIMMGGK